MRTSDREQLSQELSEQLSNLKTRLENVLPEIEKDIRDLNDSEELMRKIIDDSQPYHEWIKEKLPPGIERPSTFDTHGLKFVLPEKMEELLRLIENWTVYGKIIEEQLKLHRKAMQDDIDRRVGNN